MHFFFLICTTFGEEKRSFCFLPPPFFSGWHLNILVYNLALHSSPLLPSFASHAQSHKLLKYSSSLLLPLQEEASFGGREGGREEEGIHQYFFLTSDGRSLLSCSTCTTVYTHTRITSKHKFFLFLLQAVSLLVQSINLLKQYFWVSFLGRNFMTLFFSISFHPLAGVWIMNLLN